MVGGAGGRGGGGGSYIQGRTHYTLGIRSRPWLPPQNPHRHHHLLPTHPQGVDAKQLHAEGTGALRPLLVLLAGLQSVKLQAGPGPGPGRGGKGSRQMWFCALNILLWRAQPHQWLHLDPTFRRVGGWGVCVWRHGCGGGRASQAPGRAGQGGERQGRPTRSTASPIASVVV